MFILRKKTQKENIFTQFEFIVARPETSGLAENLIETFSLILSKFYLELGLQKNTTIFSLSENFCINSNNLLFLVRTPLLMLSIVFYSEKTKKINNNIPLNSSWFWKKNFKK